MTRTLLAAAILAGFAMLFWGFCMMQAGQHSLVTLGGLFVAWAGAAVLAVIFWPCVARRL